MIKRFLWVTLGLLLILTTVRVAAQVFPIRASHLYSWSGTAWVPVTGTATNPQPTDVRPLENAHVYVWNGSAWVAGAIGGGGGGGTPASPTTSIQFNNAGSFGGSSNLTWNGSIVQVGPTLNTGVSGINVTGVNTGGLVTLNVDDKESLAGSFPVAFSVTETANPLVNVDVGDVIGAGITSNAAGAGSADSNTGLSITQSNTSGQGIVNAYGLNIGNISGATNNYAIKTGTGLVSFGGNVVSPTLITPTIASFANATHTHLNAAGGGTLTAAAVTNLNSATITFTNKSGNISQWTNDSNYLTAITGGTCTNQLVRVISAAGVPTCVTVTSAYVDGSIAPTASPSLTGVPLAPTAAAGTNTTQIATTAYTTTAIANAIAAVNPSVAVQAATTTILPNSPIYSNGAGGIGATITTLTLNTALVIDGHTMLLGERLLVKNEGGGGGLGTPDNGVYSVTTIQSAGVAWILTRALDFDQPSDMNNSGAIPVVNGTVNGTTTWLLTSTVNTVGTDAVTFTKFSFNPSNVVTSAIGTANQLTVSSATGDVTFSLAGPHNFTSLTGLALGSGSSALTAYGGTTCTNQVLTALSASGAGTCATITSAYVDSSIPSLTSTSTFTNKRITKRVVTASDATSVTANSDNADITYQSNSQSTGTLTMNADTGTPTNGQAWLFKIKSTNVQTFSWNALYVGGTTALPTTTTGGGKIDSYAFIYDTVNSKWQYTGSALGF